MNLAQPKEPMQVIIGGQRGKQTLSLMKVKAVGNCLRKVLQIQTDPCINLRGYSIRKMIILTFGLTAMLVGRPLQDQAWGCVCGRVAMDMAPSDVRTGVCTNSAVYKVHDELVGGCSLAVEVDSKENHTWSVSLSIRCDMGPEFLLVFP